MMPARTCRRNGTKKTPRCVCRWISFWILVCTSSCLRSLHTVHFTHTILLTPLPSLHCLMLHTMRLTASSIALPDGKEDRCQGMSILAPAGHGVHARRYFGTRWEQGLPKGIALSGLYLEYAVRRTVSTFRPPTLSQGAAAASSGCSFCCTRLLSFCPRAVLAFCLHHSVVLRVHTAVLPFECISCRRLCTVHHSVVYCSCCCSCCYF